MLPRWAMVVYCKSLNGRKLNKIVSFMTNVSSILYEDDDTVAIYYLIVTVAPDWIIKNEQFFKDT